MINRRQTLALIALTLMWSINWPMMKLSLRELTPLYFRALTMSCGALWLFVFYRARGLRVLPRGGEWRQVISLGLPNMLGWHTLSILGVKELASGRAAVLGFTMPIWTVLLGVVFLGEKLTFRVVFAAFAVAISIFLFIFYEVPGLSGHPLGIMWMEMAAVCWAYGTLMMRRARLTLPVESLTVWMMISASLCLWAIAAFSEPWPVWSFSSSMWVGLAYGALINYGFAQVIWAQLARNLPPATSTISLMAVPIVGTLAAMVIVGEWPQWQDFVAIVFVTAAIAAVLMPPRTSLKPA